MSLGGQGYCTWRWHRTASAVLRRGLLEPASVWPVGAVRAAAACAALGTNSRCVWAACAESISPTARRRAVRLRANRRVATATARIRPRRTAYTQVTRPADRTCTPEPIERVRRTTRAARAPTAKPEADRPRAVLPTRSTVPASFSTATSAAVPLGAPLAHHVHARVRC